MTVGTADLAGVGEVRHGSAHLDRPARRGCRCGRRSSCAPTARRSPCTVGRRRTTAGCASPWTTQQRGVAPGQSAVLYEPDPVRGDRVLGQGTVVTTA